MFRWLPISIFIILFTGYNIACPTGLRTLLANSSTQILTEQYSSDELPSIIIAYNLFCARYQSFKLIESNPQNCLIKLDKNINRISVGIPTSLAFTHIAFTVQNNIIGHQSGFLRIKNKTLEESGVPLERILFVTTHIESFGNRILVILSAVSPEYITIFSVDNKLNAEMLYDRDKIREVTNLNGIKETISIGSIYGVQVIKPGYFLLQERMEPGGYAFPHLFSRYENRTIVIDVTKGNFRMEIEK